MWKWELLLLIKSRHLSNQNIPVSGNSVPLKFVHSVSCLLLQDFQTWNENPNLGLVFWTSSTDISERIFWKSPLTLEGVKSQLWTESLKKSTSYLLLRKSTLHRSLGKVRGAGQKVKFEQKFSKKSAEGVRSQLWTEVFEKVRGGS
jgi:hypothetical protein